MKPEDITMDFFSKLDNGRYAEFKMTSINGLQMKSVQPPKNVTKFSRWLTLTLSQSWW